MPIYLICDLINVNHKCSPYGREQIGIKFMYKKDIHVNRLESVIFDM